jgi:hypothetical protein
MAEMDGHWQIKNATSKSALIAKYEALPVTAQKQVEAEDFLPRITGIARMGKLSLQHSFLIPVIREIRGYSSSFETGRPVPP